MVNVVESGCLSTSGPVPWHSVIRLRDASPVLERLAALPDVGLVAGRLSNLQLVAARTAAFPYLGLTPPPPNYMPKAATLSPGQNSEADNAG